MKKILFIFLVFLLTGCEEKYTWKDPKIYSNDISYAVEIFKQEGHQIEDILSYYQTYGDVHPTKTVLYGQHAVYFVGKKHILNELHFDENETIDQNYKKYDEIINGKNVNHSTNVFTIKTTSKEYDKLYIVDANTLKYREQILYKTTILSEEYASNVLLAYEPEANISTIQRINDEAILIGLVIGQHNAIAIITNNSFVYDLYPNEEEYSGIKQNLVIEEINEKAADEKPMYYKIKDTNYNIYFKIDETYEIRELGGVYES